MQCSVTGRCGCRLSRIKNLGIINYTFIIQFLPPEKDYEKRPLVLQQCINATQFWLHFMILILFSHLHPSL